MSCLATIDCINSSLGPPPTCQKGECICPYGFYYETKNLGGCNNGTSNYGPDMTGILIPIGIILIMLTIIACIICFICRICRKGRIMPPPQYQSMTRSVSSSGRPPIPTPRSSISQSVKHFQPPIIVQQPPPGPLTSMANSLNRLASNIAQPQPQVVIIKPQPTPRRRYPRVIDAKRRQTRPVSVIVEIEDEMLVELMDEGRVVSRDLVTLGDPIGQGNFGTVYVGSLRFTNGQADMVIAVKTLNGGLYVSDNDVQNFVREALVMKNFDHPHVLNLIGICFDGRIPYVLLPFMENGSLLKYLQSDQNESTVGDLIDFSVQIAQGMEYLAKKKFVHRDLAARNCMLDEFMMVRVGDFGLARDVYDKEYYVAGEGSQIPIRWAAPECLAGHKKFSVKSDVWSFGVTFWEVMTRGLLPYQSVTNQNIWHHLMTGRRLEQPFLCPDGIYQIMLKCWSLGPEERPSFSEILKEVHQVVNSLSPNQAN